LTQTTDLENPHFHPKFTSERKRCSKD